MLKTRVTTKLTDPIHNQVRHKSGKIDITPSESWYRNGPDLLQAPQTKWWFKEQFTKPK